MSDGSLFTPESLTAKLKGPAASLRIKIFDEVNSTSTAARLSYESGEAPGLAVLAGRQTEGRGTKGRSFFSPEGTGLYLSLLFEPDIPISDSALVTTSAASAAALALEKISGEKIDIKWVNDLYLRGRKICGILTEGIMTGKGWACIVGIGINLLPPEKGFPAELSGIAGSLFPSRKGDISSLRIQAAAEILNRFMKFTGELRQRTYMPYYKERLFVLGKKISVVSPSGIRPAEALDTDDLCRLRVRYDDGTEDLLFSGEISVNVMQ